MRSSIVYSITTAHTVSWSRCTYRYRWNFLPNGFHRAAIECLHVHTQTSAVSNRDETYWRTVYMDMRYDNDWRLQYVGVKYVAIRA